MAKQQLAITRFEGGLMSDPNPRDIGNNQFSVLKGFSVDSVGSIIMIGAMANHPSIDANVDTTTTFPPGYGLFSFSSDKSDTGVGLATDYLVLTNGDFIHVWDDGGDEWNDMVDTVLDDTTGFSITNEPIPSPTTTDHIWSFYAPDGDLRVSDGKFSNYNHTTKILKYIDPKIIGKSDNTLRPTTFAQASIGRAWVKGEASIEHGLNSNHLKMINLGDVAKGTVEGDAGDNILDGSGTRFITTIAGNRITVASGGVDHGALAGTDHYYNGLTCSLFKAGESAIYGVVYNYDQSSAYFDVWTGVDGDVTPAAALTAANFAIKNCTTTTGGSAHIVTHTADVRIVAGMGVTGTGIPADTFIRSISGTTTFVMGDNATPGGGATVDATAANTDTTITFAQAGLNWSFQVGQQEGLMWNSQLHESALARGVISSDYGMTLIFSEGNSSSGSWMPTANTRYKFYHTTTFDASTGSMKQQESSPSLFNMYPRKSAAGVTGGTGGDAHDSVKEMFFCAGDSELATDNKVGTAVSSLSLNFGLMMRLRADNSPASNNWTIGASDYDEAVQDTSITEGLYNFLGGNKRVTGGRIYWASSEDGFNSLNLLMDYDLEKGIRPVGSGSGQSSIGGYAKWQSWVYPVASNPLLVGAFANEESTWYVPPVLETYETINGYNYDAKLDAKWKTAIIANNRVYAANILRKEKSIFDSSSFTDATCVTANTDATITHTSTPTIKLGMIVTGTGIPDGSYVKSITSLTSFELSANATATTDPVTLTFIGNGWNITYGDDIAFQDRIIKSPVGKYDTFPDSEGYVIEGFNSDDGDEIIKLESFADRLLVFKKYKLQIYNIQKREFLEDEVLYNGLDGANPCQACATDFGIAWINSKGVYFYDGRQVQSLTDGVLREVWVNGGAGYDTAHWLGNTSDVPAIAFDPDSKKLLCLKTANAAGSDNVTCLIYSFKTKSWTTMPSGGSIDNNKDKRFAHFKGQLVMDNGTQVKVWKDEAAIGGGGGQQAFTTKDIDFGTPGVRKKIYKVYITYQSGNATTNVQVKYGVNGSSTQALTFKDGDYFTSNELLAANGWQVAELKPTTSSEANSKKSFQLALTCDGAVPAAFEIDDITIVYRTKSVK